MKILQDVPLALYSTMRLGGKASSVVEVSNENELLEALKWAKDKNKPVIMIGSGSNIVWRDEGFNGLLLINQFMGYKITVDNDSSYDITVGAGEDWDGVVKRSVVAGASGLEALSLIPGKTGATPIQNVGAYGQEISSTLIDVRAYDNLSESFVTLSNKDCDFKYRSSIFNSSAKGRYFITSVNFHLTKTMPKSPFYAVLQAYLDENNISDYSVSNIRNAVIAIRLAKLPDPTKVANTGSFFSNPLVDSKTFQALLSKFPDIAHWPAAEPYEKISAAWLIEQAGFKDVHDSLTGMATWPTQPLVIVNESAKHTADLMAFKQKIIESVRQKFGITLIQEPELLP